MQTEAYKYVKDYHSYWDETEGKDVMVFSPCVWITMKWLENHHIPENELFGNEVKVQLQSLADKGDWPMLDLIRGAYEERTDPRGGFVCDHKDSAQQIVDLFRPLYRNIDRRKGLLEMIKTREGIEVAEVLSHTFFHDYLF